MPNSLLALSELLEPPGASKVLLIWPAAATPHICHTEIYPHATQYIDELPPGTKEMYLVGRFHLDGYSGAASLNDALNALRARHGLRPLHAELVSLLRPERDGVWQGAVKVQLDMFANERPGSHEPVALGDKGFSHALTS